MLEANSRGPKLLVARKGKDLAFLPENSYWWSDASGWVRRSEADALSWFVLDDRKMYKPGEEVSLKGWLRTIDPGKNGDVNGLGGLATSVSYKVQDAVGNQIARP